MCVCICVCIVNAVEYACARTRQIVDYTSFYLDRTGHVRGNTVHDNISISYDLYSRND